MIVSAPQNRKFKELVIYVAQKSSDDPKFGSIKLNKIIAYSDMIHYIKTGKSITNVSYMKQQNGVVARCMKPVLVELDDSKELVIVPKERHGYVAKVPTALRQARVDTFSATEIETIQEVIKMFENKNGSGVSHISHSLTPNWDYLPIGVEIPISALVYPSNYRLTPEENSHFKQVLRDSAWGKELLSAWSAA